MARYRWSSTLNAWVTDATSGGAVVWDEVAGKPTSFPPAQHRHSFTDLPTGVLGFAVGTNSARPSAGMVIWFAAAEPNQMLDGDVLFINSVFG